MPEGDSLQGFTVIAGIQQKRLSNGAFRLSLTVNSPVPHIDGRYFL